MDAALLQDPVLLKELHKLLWIEPFNNKGTWDLGWSCRDHALVVACILRAQGISTDFCRGFQMCVQGPREGAPPIGLGQGKPGDGDHMWLRLPSGGIVDLSVRLSGTGLGVGWRSLEIEAVVDGAWLPASVGSVVECDSVVEYQNWIARATHRVDENCLIYCHLQTLPIERSTVVDAFQFVNSPLTDRLRKMKDPELYAKAVGHITDVVAGTVRPAAGLSQKRMWEIVAKRPSGETARLLERLGL